MGPPAEPCECYCLHCQRVVNSGDIWWQAVVGSPDGFPGFWMCPTPNCSGAGFGFDLHPTDPDHPANEGWTFSDDADEDGDEPDDDPPYDPDEPHFADEAMDDDPDDDLEGEEWKLGLLPGERPPESADALAARAEWEAEQREYDEPDRRPRTIDGSRWQGRRRAEPSADAWGEITEDDIPF